MPGTELAPEEIPDLLAILVERSLVVCDPITGRHNLTESMRVYALDHLADEEAAIREKHFRYFESQAEQIFRIAWERNVAESVNPYSAESDNFRSALEWVSKHDAKKQLHLISLLAKTWFRVHPQESRAELEKAILAAPMEDDADHAWADLSTAAHQLRTGDASGVDALFDKCIRSFDSLGIVLGKAHALVDRGWHANWIPDLEASRRFNLEAIAIAKEHGGLAHIIEWASINLGEVARGNGDFYEAERWYQLAIEGTNPDSEVAIIACFNSGCVCIQRGDVEEAERYFLISLEPGRRNAGHALNAADGLDGLAMVAVLRQDYRRAGLLNGYAQGNRERKGISLDPGDKKLLDIHIRIAEEKGKEVFSDAHQQGFNMTVKQIDELVYGE